MKKQAVFLLISILCAGSLLFGCSAQDTSETTPESETAITEATTVPETVETFQTSETSDASESNIGYGSYVNLDCMQFTINGKTYTLGKTTLREMIDDGVPFREKDLANAGNNLNDNTESQSFAIELSEYWSAQVSVMNDTDDNRVTSDCYICNIYLPVHDDESQDILSFDFPLDLNMDDLKVHAGEPTDSYHYDGDNNYYSDTMEYTRESTRYFGDCGYTFEFINGTLNYVTIAYLP